MGIDESYNFARLIVDVPDPPACPGLSYKVCSVEVGNVPDSALCLPSIKCLVIDPVDARGAAAKGVLHEAENATVDGDIVAASAKRRKLRDLRHVMQMILWGSRIVHCMLGLRLRLLRIRFRLIIVVR